MKKFEFKYIDKYSHGKWSKCSGEFKTLREALEFFGFEDDPDCYEYQIVSITEIER